MVQIIFGEVKKAIRTPKPIATTLFMNWAIKPFTMALFAWLFLIYHLTELGEKMLESVEKL